MNISNHNQRIEILEDIKNRFNLVITVSIFFPTLTSTLIQLSKNQELVAESLLSFSVPAGLYILSYVLFELHKKDISDIFLNRISNLLLWCIGVFTIPILVITGFYKASLNVLISRLFLISIYGIPILAVIFFLLIIASLNNSINRLNK